MFQQERHPQRGDSESVSLLDIYYIQDNNSNSQSWLSTGVLSSLLSCTAGRPGDHNKDHQRRHRCRSKGDKSRSQRQPVRGTTRSHQSLARMSQPEHQHQHQQQQQQQKQQQQQQPYPLPSHIVSDNNGIHNSHDFFRGQKQMPTFNAWQWDNDDYFHVEWTNKLVSQRSDATPSSPSKSSQRTSHSHRTLGTANLTASTFTFTDEEDDTTEEGSYQRQRRYHLNQLHQQFAVNEASRTKLLQPQILAALHKSPSSSSSPPPQSLFSPKVMTTPTTNSNSRKSKDATPVVDNRQNPTWQSPFQQKPQKYSPRQQNRHDHHHHQLHQHQLQHPAQSHSSKYSTTPSKLGMMTIPTQVPSLAETVSTSFSSTTDDVSFLSFHHDDVDSYHHRHHNTRGDCQPQHHCKSRLSRGHTGREQEEGDDINIALNDSIATSLSSSSSSSSWSSLQGQSHTESVELQYWRRRASESFDRYRMDHCETAKAFLDLGMAHMRCQQYAAAQDFFRTAIRIFERKFGHNDLRVARSLEALGMAQSSSNSSKQHQQDNNSHNFQNIRNSNHRSSKAGLLLGLQSLRKAFRIRYDILGPTHIDTVETLNKIANIHMKLGMFSSAKNDYMEVLTLRTAILGDTHPSVAVAAQSLGMAYLDSNETERAKQYFLRALNVFALAGLPDHPFAVKLREMVTKLGFDLARVEI